jgi:hypothetical protein
MEINLKQCFLNETTKYFILVAALFSAAFASEEVAIGNEVTGHPDAATATELLKARHIRGESSKKILFPRILARGHASNLARLLARQRYMEIQARAPE